MPEFGENRKLSFHVFPFTDKARKPKNERAFCGLVVFKIPVLEILEAIAAGAGLGSVHL